jgi:hypothetical protein
MRRIVVAASAALLCACTGAIDRAPAEDAVQRFHAELDSGRLDAIYDAAAPALKSGTPRDRFVGLLSGIHAKLGAVRSSAQKRWTLQRRASDALLTLDYATAYSGGEADERFVFWMKGDRVALVEYRIHSAALGDAAVHE